LRVRVKVLLSLKRKTVRTLAIQIMVHFSISDQNHMKRFVTFRPFFTPKLQKSLLQTVLLQTYEIGTAIIRSTCTFRTVIFRLKFYW